ncbi:hypothetical protein SCH01S_19_00840 [Sphingomonas changbaiensis NBRC 104936]|uniref:EfeO-type cupredoxin-like domain-containing protein n=2 Tax=Sphingomonas changbaiensis TaxID=529705 RepID=A0A0E9MNS2_9SPHN|nr:hypothetical protein SCH01S_19_00840 [Sphingomonas changbaiensis NBRC 104936]
MGRDLVIEEGSLGPRSIAVGRPSFGQSKTVRCKRREMWEPQPGSGIQYLGNPNARIVTQRVAAGTVSKGAGLMRTAILSVFLCALPLCDAALAQASPSGAREIEIDLSSFKFTPAIISLQDGQVYRLHFVNRADGGHDFVAKAFFADARIAPEDAGKMKGGEVELKGGAPVDVMLTPQNAGSYKVHYSHFMHSAFGMTGKIIVS